MENEDKNVMQSGMLAVGDGHQVYWEDWGAPDATPIMVFHGGPGAGISKKVKLLLDPTRHRAVFFDQRGSGKSTPFASTKDNTTQKLVADTDALRAHLGIERMYLLGGSWGSTMVLNYAIAHPDRVLAMLCWGMYLGTDFENDLISMGHAKYNYPEAWERFIAPVPETERNSGMAITQFYAAKMESKDATEALHFAREWVLWEATLASIEYFRPKEEQAISETDESLLALAKLECHYFLNHCFMPDNFILDAVGTIAHIPLYVVQGRFDNVTPPVTAYNFQKAYGANMTLQIVNAGHDRADPEARTAIMAAARLLFV